VSTRIQRRGGTTAEHSAFTGAPREITVNTTDNRAVVHDGSTPGGHPVAKVADYTAASVLSKLLTVDGVGSGVDADKVQGVTPGASGLAVLAAADAAALTVAIGQVGPILGTQVATTSGTSIDFTGIPSWAKRITILLDNVSTNGTSPVIVQLGDSGGPETSGYTGGLGTITGSTAAGAASALAGLQLVAGTATAVRSGTVTISLMNAATFKWVMVGVIGDNAGSGAAGYTVAVKSTSAALDRIRLTTVGGTDTFDAGSMNISWE
jgi:hypothetical protein